MITPTRKKRSSSRVCRSLAALPLCVATFAFASGQSVPTESEEFVELSPFVIDSGSDGGYRAANTLAGARVATPLLDPSAGNFPPSVPVSILHRAESVAIQFVLTNAADRQDERNRELYASVDAIEAEVKKTPGLRLEQREVHFAGGNKRLFSTKGSEATTSFASIVIFAELSTETRIVDRVKQVRDLLQAIKLSGHTKAVDGSVGLYVRNIDQYRREILEKIFEDLSFLKKGLGPEFEVKPSGLNQRVRARIASETEIELWIDYSFTIQSLRELEAAANPFAPSSTRR